MPKRSSRRDFVEIGFEIGQRATRERPVKDKASKEKQPIQIPKIKHRPPPRPPTHRPDAFVLMHGPNPISSYAAMLGSLGGKKGGPARAKALSKKKRAAIAKKAAKARWKKKSK